MKVADFDKLKSKDFRNGAVLDEIRSALKRLESNVEELACPECGHIVRCLAPLCEFKSKVTP